MPKNRIYEHAGASTALKDLFVTQVDQIVWKFKLAPETINLAATKAVSEIQVFGISLRTGKLDEDVLRAIDRAIPFPLIFELSWSGKRKAIAAFKRPSEADPTKWVVSEYFATDWAPEDAPRRPLPVALNLGGLYDALLTALMPKASPNGAARTSRRAWRGWRRSGPRRGRWTGSRPASPARSSSTSAWRSTPSCARHRQELERLTGGRSCQRRDE